MGLEHLGKTLASARARVDDSHKMQFAKLKEVTGYEGENTEADDVAINVSGDTHISVPSVGQSVATGQSKLASAVAIAALLAGGAGVGYIANDAINGDKPAMVDTDTDTISVIDFPDN